MALLFASCGNNSGKAQTAEAAIQTFNADAFEKKLNETNNRTILDVRTQGEFEQGHILGALNLNVNDGNFESSAAKLDTTKPVFVYCLAGSRSLRAAEILQGMGFKTIYNLAGGMAEWNGASKPIEKGNTPVKKGMTKIEFDNLVLHGDTLVFVDFNATWCAPCKKILAYVPELEKEYAGKLIVVKIDYDQNMDLAKEIKANSVPYLYLMRAGIQQWEHSGFASKSEVKKAIDAVLAKKK